jgi:hypothetical protein
MQALSLAAPFVLGGALKIVYDVLLYLTCRRVVPPDADARPDGREERPSRGPALS